MKSASHPGTEYGGHLVLALSSFSPAEAWPSIPRYAQSLVIRLAVMKLCL